MRSSLLKGAVELHDADFILFRSTALVRVVQQTQHPLARTRHIHQHPPPTRFGHRPCTRRDCFACKSGHGLRTPRHLRRNYAVDERKCGHRTWCVRPNVEGGMCRCGYCETSAKRWETRVGACFSGLLRAFLSVSCSVLFFLSTPHSPDGRLSLVVGHFGICRLIHRTLCLRPDLTYSILSRWPVRSCCAI